MNADTDSPRPAAPAARAGSLAALMAVAGIGGIVLGAIVSSVVAGLLADWLDLGLFRERLVFAFTASLIGAATGMGAALWLVLRLRLPRERLWRGAFGLLAGAGAAALVLFGFFFAANTPPPPVLPILNVEVRISPAGSGADDAAISVHPAREGQGLTGIRVRSDPEGRTVVGGSFWMSRQAPVEWLILTRRGLPETRFTLNLPADPPSMGDFTQWLSADRSMTGPDEAPRELIELRFRIDRRAAQ